MRTWGPPAEGRGALRVFPVTSSKQTEFATAVNKILGMPSEYLYKAIAGSLLPGSFDLFLVHLAARAQTLAKRTAGLRSAGGTEEMPGRACHDT